MPSIVRPARSAGAAPRCPLDRFRPNTVIVGAAFREESAGPVGHGRHREERRARANGRSGVAR